MAPASIDTTVSAKLIFTYNSFLIDFLLLLKRVSPTLKQKVKDNYRSIDKRDAAHLQFAVAHLPLQLLSQCSPAALLQKPDKDIATDNAQQVLDTIVVEGITLRDILSATEADGPSDAGGLVRILYVLASVARLYEQMTEANDQDTSGIQSLEGVLELIIRIQAVSGWSGWPSAPPDIKDLDVAIEATQDACVRGLLKGLMDSSCVRSTDADKPGGDGGGPEVPDALLETLTSLQNSKIGAIAKEIAEEIDLSGMDANAPEKWLDLASLTNPNSFLGSVVNKLGTKLTHKMQNGDLKQEDLFKDAMTLMQGMGLEMPGGGPGEKAPGPGPGPGLGPGMGADFFQNLMTMASKMGEQQQQQQAPLAGRKRGP